jgi:exo-beta-1,3-glucanase (GH17 family)
MSPRVTAALLPLMLALLVTAASAAAGPRVRPLRMSPNGVAYGPHRDGQRPGGPSPTKAQLREDLHLIARHWQSVRVYVASEFADTMLQVIRDDGLRLHVLLGVWIGEDDRREIEAAVRLAREYPRHVRAIAVGNETQVFWSAHRQPVERLMSALREVRERTRVPVTTADDYNFWNKPESRGVAVAVDFVTLHLHPLWNGARNDSALAWVQGQYAAIRAMHPGRAVVIGETGWATERGDDGDQGKLMKGSLGEAEQARYLRELRGWTGPARIPTFVFEAFDENWKGGPAPADVEKHWGLYRADRSPKAAVQELE